MTYAGPTDRPFTWVDGNITVDGSTLGEVTAFSMTANNNFQTFRKIGQRLLSLPVAGVRRYEFSITMKYHKDTGSVIDGLKAQSITFDGTVGSTTPNAGAVNTAVAVSLDLVEGAVSGDRVLNLDFANCFFESFSTPVAIGDADAGLIESTITGYALSGVSNIPVRWWTIA